MSIQPYKNLLEEQRENVGNFRPLTYSEMNKISHLVNDQNQLQLTRELLLLPECQPTQVIQIGEKVFLAGGLINHVDANVLL